MLHYPQQGKSASDARKRVKAWLDTGVYQYTIHRVKKAPDELQSTDGLKRGEKWYVVSYTFKGKMIK